jgi:hypothetical protein
LGCSAAGNKKYSKDSVLLNDALKCYKQQQLCFVTPHANTFLTASTPLVSVFTHTHMYELRTIFCTTRNLEQYNAEHLQLVEKHCQ